MAVKSSLLHGPLGNHVSNPKHLLQRDLGQDQIEVRMELESLHALAMHDHLFAVVHDDPRRVLGDELLRFPLSGAEVDQHFHHGTAAEGFRHALLALLEGDLAADEGPDADGAGRGQPDRFRSGLPVAAGPVAERRREFRITVGLVRLLPSPAKQSLRRLTPDYRKRYEARVAEVIMRVTRELAAFTAWMRTSGRSF
jgi:hypothetical protein